MAIPNVRRGPRGRDGTARLTRQFHWLSPGCRIWRAISGLARACSAGRADTRLRRRGKPATAGARSWKNRAAWNAPNASDAKGRSRGCRPQTHVLFSNGRFETKFGQESLKIGRLSKACRGKFSDRVSEWLPGPCGPHACGRVSALPPRAALATSVVDFPLIAP
jgi:hypothetical protein